MVTDTWKNYNTGYYLYPRSSIVKTQFRLANSVGIIDSGYRGNIMGVFDIKELQSTKLDFKLEKYTRLLQICSPTLCPIYVILVKTEEELGETERGLGGFGSSGIIGVKNNNTPLEYSSDDNELPPLKLNTISEDEYKDEYKDEDNEEEEDEEDDEEEDNKQISFMSFIKSSFV